MSLFDEKGFLDQIAEIVRTVMKEELGGRLEASDYLPVREAARIAEVAPATIRMWLDTGKLRRYHAGRLLRVRRSELDAFLASECSLRSKEPSPEEQALLAFQRRKARGRPPE